MTTFEMQQLFETLLQTSSPLFNDAEKPDTDTIFRYLNESQIKYIKEKYLSAPSFYERTKILGNNLNDLKNLIKHLTLTNVTVTPHTNTYLFKPTTAYVWHYISATGVITRTYPYATTTTLIDLMPVEAGEVNKYLTTSINKPLILVPVFTQTNNDTEDSYNSISSLMVIFDSYTTYTTTNTKAHCLVMPRKLVLDASDAATETEVCELADYLHEDIVRLAVDLFEQQKYKLASKEDKK